MKYVSFLTFVPLLIVLTACSATIDATSDESYQNSLLNIQESLKEDDKQRLQTALEAIAFEDITDIKDIMEIGNDPDQYAINARTKLDGLTYSEIITKGNTIVKRKKQAQREAIVANIKELDVRQEKAASMQESGFIVENARFYFKESYGWHDAIVEMDVTNNTEQPISRVYFNAILESPGRSIPWAQENFNYTISGGLESQESDKWSLKLDSYGDLASAPKDRNDMILTVEVVKLEGVNNEVVFDAQFTSSDADRLKTLQQELRTIEQVLSEL